MNNVNKKLIGVVSLLAVIGGISVLLLRPEPSKETIKIGFVGPLTGSLASIGESSLAGALLAVTEINESGGLLGKPIELIAEDDRCSAKGGVDAITKLIEVDKVLAVSGPDCSSSGSAALPIAQNKKVPVVIRWASAPSLAKIGDYIFRVYPSDALQGKFVAEHIFNTLHKSKVAVLYVKNDWGQGIADVFVGRFKELGGDVAYQAGMLEDSRDMKTELGNIRMSGAEILFAPLHEATGIVGLKQAKELGITIPIIGGDVFESTEVQKSPGAGGVLFSSAVIANPPAFQEQIRVKTGKDGSKITAPLGYDSVMVIAKAIKRANSTDRKAVRASLEQTSTEGIAFPRIEFDRDGDLLGATYEIKMIPK